MRIITRFLEYFFVILSYIIPKEKNTIGFVSLQFRGKFSGNNKALFLYIQENLELLPKGVKVFYITNQKTTYDLLKSKGFEVKYSKYFWLWDLVRAEYIITDGARSFIGLGKFKIVQLWHGSGYKKIGLSYSGKKNNNLRHFHLKRFFNKMVLVCAASEMDKKLKIDAFQNEKVVITGSPCNDLLYLDNKSNIDNLNIILYAPTFRDIQGNFSAFSDDGWMKMNDLMQRTNNVFWVKRHPGDYKLIVPNHLPFIRDVTNATEDIQELLRNTKLLITDYSAISSDYSFTERPIIFYTYDFEEYLNSSRTFYYDIKSLLPGPFAVNEIQLFNLLEDISWFTDEGYQNRYNIFRSNFHQFHDNKASERFFKHMINALFHKT